MKTSYYVSLGYLAKFFINPLILSVSLFAIFCANKKCNNLMSWVVIIHFSPGAVKLV